MSVSSVYYSPLPKVASTARRSTEMLAGSICSGYTPRKVQAVRPALRVKACLDAPPAIQLVPQSAWLTPKPDVSWTRFVCFSDTHGLHEKIPAANQPAGDVLLHAGDFTATGRHEQVESFGRWVARYPCTDKVVIAGNHDITFDEHYYNATGADRFHEGKPYDCTQARRLLSGCTYLQDELAEVQGYTIYGSPWQPAFNNWAFNMPRGSKAAHWASTPAAVDVLLTHGPPLGCGDLILPAGIREGDCDLRAAIEERAISVHVCGHLHEGYGATRRGGTLFINAATSDERHEPTNPPLVFDCPPPQVMRATAAAALQERQQSSELDSLGFHVRVEEMFSFGSSN